MHHRGHWRGAAGLDVSGGSRNGGGGGNASQERSQHIAHALTEELPVGVMPGAGHAVQHHGAEQGFDGSQHRHGKRRHNKSLNGGEIKNQRLAVGAGKIPREHEFRQEGRNAVPLSAVRIKVMKTASDGGDFHAGIAGQNIGGESAQKHRREMARETDFELAPDDEGKQGYRSYRGIAPVYFADIGGQSKELVHKGFRHHDVKAQKILDLKHGDDDADTHGKA